MSIEIGNRVFDGPHLIKDWDPLNFPAIYAVLMKPDPKMNLKVTSSCISASQRSFQG